ncbi:LCP family protein [Candidatus Gottesmanbacteria bacterium]|nr:LCP family protein [Candidatus Gottesmanbacteria bacterium]
MKKLVPPKPPKKKISPSWHLPNRGYLIAFIFVVVILSIVLLKLKDVYTSIYTPSGAPQITQPAKNKDIYTFLLMGYAGGNHDGPYLTDTMMVVSLDTKKKTVLLVSIPRDLWVKLPTRSGRDLHTKINTVYQREIFANETTDLDPVYLGNKEDATFTKYVVSEVLGIPIDNYAAIDFAGFITTIDLLGGVDIQVPKSFDDPEYPIEGKENDICGQNVGDLPRLIEIATISALQAFPCRYEILHFDQGPNHMDGVLALKFVRSRHSKQDGTDFGRAERQQLLLEGVKNKILSISFIPKIIPFIDEMKKYVKTDLEILQIQKLIQESEKQKLYTVIPLVLSDKNYVDVTQSEDGQYILIPKSGVDNWDVLHKEIKRLTEDIGNTPTPPQKPSS